jgi:hypothetical protein
LKIELGIYVYLVSISMQIIQDQLIFMEEGMKANLQVSLKKTPYNVVNTEKIVV